MSRQPGGNRQISLVASLVESLFSRRGLEDKRREYRAWLFWEEVVGPQVAARAKPVRIREGILEVRVDHPVWMQQLQLLKPKILAKLNSRLGEDVIRDLFFRRGGQKTDPQPLPAQPTKPDWHAVQLSEEEFRQVREIVHSVADPELRQSLEQLMTRQKRLDHARHQDA